MARRGQLAALAAAAALLAGCAARGDASTGTWVPKPSFTGREPSVQLPSPTGVGPSSTNPSAPPTGSPLPPNSGGPSTSPSGSGDPAVVATKLAAPIGLVVLPDGTALVGERTTGRIVHVQKEAGQPVITVRTIPGLDSSGDGGLLDLALSPTYDEDRLIYAYVTTAGDNRVIEFTLTGVATPVLTGIPKGRTDNAGRITFGTDQNLYVGTGDAGNPALAANPKSLAGKVLRVDGIGHPVAGNPNPSSPIYNIGHRTVDGICQDVSTGSMFDTQARSDGAPDEVNQVVRNANYGWGRATTGGATAPVATLPATRGHAGGCAIANKVLFVASLDGHALLAARLSGSAPSPIIGPFNVALDKKYGRLHTVVAAADGSLWLTTSNKDGHGSPVPTDERVIRILASDAVGGTSPL
jgi:glucose/arabinose dehydrogenase